jgi:type I restriction enzyme S subunit
MRDEWSGPFSLEDVTTEQRGGYWGESSPSAKRPVRVNVIRNGDIRPDGDLSGMVSRYFSEQEAIKSHIQEGDVLFTSSGEVGKAHLVRDGGLAHVSNFVRCLRSDPSMVSGAYLRYALQTSTARAVLRKHTGGSTISNVLRSFYSEPWLYIPPMSQQRRIQDLLDAIAVLKAAVAEGRERACAALAAVVREHMTDGDCDMRAVRDLCSLVIGGVWGRPSGQSDRDVLALGPRIFRSSTPTLDSAGSPIRSVSEAQYQSRLVRCGDIVLERSGGSPDQPVGRVVTADGSVAACMPTDFMRLLRPDPSKVLPRYLFWRLWLDHLDGMTVAYSRRTTGISNLSVGQYLDRLVALPTPDAQRRLVSVADAAALLVSRLSTYIVSVDELHSVLLADLLLSRTEIPDSYDRFVQPD